MTPTTEPREELENQLIPVMTTASRNVFSYWLLSLLNRRLGLANTPFLGSTELVGVCLELNDLYIRVCSLLHTEGNRKREKNSTQ